MASTHAPLAPLGFDLMSQKPQRGDRSRRDDDRYLFPGSADVGRTEAIHQLYRPLYSG